MPNTAMALRWGGRVESRNVDDHALGQQPRSGPAWPATSNNTNRISPSCGLRAAPQRAPRPDYSAAARNLPKPPIGWALPIITAAMSFRTVGDRR